MATKKTSSSSKSSGKSSTKSSKPTSGAKKKTTAKTASKSTSKKKDTSLETSIAGMVGGNVGNIVEELTHNAKDKVLDEIEHKTSDIKNAIVSGKGIDGVKDALFNDDKKAKTEESGSTDAKQLRELKGLFDDGIITKAEFEAKKKKLLGI